MRTVLLIAAGVIVVMIIARYSPRDWVPAEEHRRMCPLHLRLVFRCLRRLEVEHALEHVVAGIYHGWQWLVDIMRG